METSVGKLLAEFNRQRASSPAAIERSLLTAGQQQLKRMLQEETVLSADTVHAGRALLAHLDDMDTVTTLLSRYLSQPLPTSEEAWAKWHRMDSMAAAHRCEEVIARQQELLYWAQHTFPTQPITVGRDFPFDLNDSQTPVMSADSLLLWVWGDGTQALCWKECEQGEAWLQTFHELLKETPPSAENRFRRFNFLRTGAAMYHWLGRSEEAVALAEKISALAEEETDWADAARWRMEGHVATLRAYVDANDTNRVRQLGTAAYTTIAEYESQLSPLTSDQARKLRDFCHNMGLPLRGARQYDLALPLLERAVALGSRSPWTFLSLAATLWATTKERSVVLPVLKQAAQCLPTVALWSEQNRPAEFADVVADPEFREAAGAV